MLTGFLKSLGCVGVGPCSTTVFVSSTTSSCAHVYTSVDYGVDVDWDPPKNAANLAERGFDFDFAGLIFDGPTVEREDNRHDYGERRVIALGMADGIQLTVVYTDRALGDGSFKRRIMSARLSSRKERRKYAQAIKAADAQSRQR